MNCCETCRHCKKIVKHEPIRSYPSKDVIKIVDGKPYDAWDCRRFPVAVPVEKDYYCGEWSSNQRVTFETEEA